MIKYLFIALISLSVYKVSAQSETNYIIILKNGMKVEAVEVEYKLSGYKLGEGIKIIDRNNLERFYAFSKIKSINHLKLSEEFRDRILFKNGKKLVGKILRVNPLENELEFIKKGDSLEVNFSEVSKIEKVVKAVESLYGKSYYELGGNLGFPAGLNFSAAYWFGAVGVRFSGLYIGIAEGAQLALNFKLSDNEERLHGLELIGGVSNIRKSTLKGDEEMKNFHWEYVGVAYCLNWRGFWAEFGYSVGEGDYSFPQPIFQIGYSARIFQ